MAGTTFGETAGLRAPEPAAQRWRRVRGEPDNEYRSFIASPWTAYIGRTIRYANDAPVPAATGPAIIPIATSDQAASSAG